MQNDPNKVCFIISHKWVVNKNNPYESYLSYYIKNINLNYENAKIIVVDNSSEHKDDIFNPLKNEKNVIFLDNNTDSRFEIGAYTVGLKYFIENNLQNEYSYVIMTQDTMVLKNKFDFNLFKNNNIKCSTIYTYPYDWIEQELVSSILNNFGMNDNYDKITLCWCNSFIVDSLKIKNLYDIFSRIKMENLKYHSQAAERWLGRVIWELNDKQTNTNIDGVAYSEYNPDFINVYENTSKYFIKKTQRKEQIIQDNTKI